MRSVGRVEQQQCQQVFYSSRQEWYNRIALEMGFGFRFIRLNEAISYVGEHLLRN